MQSTIKTLKPSSTYSFIFFFHAHDVQNTDFYDIDSFTGYEKYTQSICHITQIWP